MKLNDFLESMNIQKILIFSSKSSPFNFTDDPNGVISFLLTW